MEYSTGNRKIPDESIVGDKIVTTILAINGTVFLLFGLYGLAYHYVVTTSCLLMATLLYIAPIKRVAHKNKALYYLYYSLFGNILLMVSFTIYGLSTI